MNSYTKYAKWCQFNSKQGRKNGFMLQSLGLREIEIEAGNDLEIFKGNNTHISKHALKKRVNYTSDYALKERVNIYR